MNLPLSPAYNEGLPTPTKPSVSNQKGRFPRRGRCGSRRGNDRQVHGCRATRRRGPDSEVRSRMLQHEHAGCLRAVRPPDDECDSTRKYRAWPPFAGAIRGRPALALRSGRTRWVLSHPYPPKIMPRRGARYEGGIVSVSPYGDPAILALRARTALRASQNAVRSGRTRWVLSHPYPPKIMPRRGALFLAEKVGFEPTCQVTLTI